MIYSKRFLFVNNNYIPKTEGTCSLSGRNTPTNNDWKVTMFLQGIEWADKLTTDGFEISATFGGVTIKSVTRISNTKIDIVLSCPEWKFGTVTIRPLDSNLGENMTCPLPSNLKTDVDDGSSSG